MSDDAEADWIVGSDEKFELTVYSTNGVSDNVQLKQTGIGLQAAKSYELKFVGYADRDRLVEIKVEDQSTATDYAKIGFVEFSRRPEEFSFRLSTHNVPQATVKILFNFAQSAGEFYLDNVSLTEITDLTEQPQSTEPNSFKLYHNYPNPFNSTTNIRYSLPQSCKVSLYFYDMLGRMVKMSVVKNQPSGDHNYNFKQQNLTSGIYFCVIKAQVISGETHYSDQIKMLYLK